MKIKYRLYDWSNKKYLDPRLFAVTADGDVINKRTARTVGGISVEACCGIKDSKGVDIYEGDIVRFSDKWEWYRGQYGIKMMAAEGERLEELKAQYEAEPYEERVVKLPEAYEWLLSSEIQSYWEVIGRADEATIAA